MMTSRQCYTRTASESSHGEAERPGAFALFADLTKLKLTSMASLPALLAFLAASSGKISIFNLLLLFLSVLASASGAAALNEWSERQIDRQMRRTHRRPLPAGRISPRGALFLGLGLTLSGATFLSIHFNLLSGSLALLAAVVYWLLYTPLKQKSPWCTEVGAISGALPPLIGWAAATGNLSGNAWIFFGILFLWQMPHFHPISWRYREDYRRAALKMRVITEPTGNQAANHTILYASALIGFSLIPYFKTGNTLPLIISAVFGTLYLLASIRFRFSPNRDKAARFLFRFSLVYLPVVLVALTLSTIR